MAADDEDSRDLDVQDFRLWWEQGSPRKATEDRTRAWKRIATTLTFVGLASIVVLALKGGGPSPPKGPPVVAAVNGAEEPSVEAKTQAALVSPPVVSAVPHEAVPSTAPSAAPNVETSSLGGQAAPPSAQPPDTKPVRTAAPRPYGAAKPPSVSESVSTHGAPGTEQAVKPDSPAKHPSAKSPSVVVAKREATGPAVAADAGEQPVLPEPPVKPPDRVTTEPASPQTATDSFPASATPDDAFRQSVNRMLHTIGGLFAPRSAPAGPSVSASAPAGWAVQLAAPKSEAEAESDLRRLSAQYASALEGSRIGVRKAVVDGETVYRLRVVDLSKADASALCARLKEAGGDCFVAR